MTDNKIQNEYIDFINAVKELTEADRNNEIENNYNAYFPSIPKGEYKILLLKKVWGVYIRDLKIDTEVKISFSKIEVDFLRSLPTEEIKRIFYSLMCQAKVCPHSSGWVKLNFPDSMKYGFDSSKVKKLKITCLSQCREYGFDARVIGSNDPIVCFKLDIPGKDDGVDADADDDAVFFTTNITAREDFEENIL